ncbi:MAG: hypothetical protein LBJ31_00895, partial [Treponema sp.]|jgi:hypothetical protein|nr:hypothetical protein [Treponema sp.]
MEAVLEVHNAAMLKKMIKFVSIRASQVASKSSNTGDSGDTGDEQKQQELNANLREFQEEETAAAPDNDQDDW